MNVRAFGSRTSAPLTLFFPALRVMGREFQTLLFGLLFFFPVLKLGPEEGVITKGVFSLGESLESLKSLDSLESLENSRLLLCFPQSGVL